MGRVAGIEVLALAGSADAQGKLSDLLDALGLRPHTALTTQRAVELARARRYHLIVVDGGCPGESRDQLARAVRTEGCPNRLTPLASLNAALAGQPGGGEAAAQVLCRDLLASSLSKPDILALYRLLGKNKYGDFFKLYAALAEPGRVSGSDTQHAR
jgi:CheY-like chemotaxis protein